MKYLLIAIGLVPVAYVFGLMLSFLMTIKTQGTDIIQEAFGYIISVACVIGGLIVCCYVYPFSQGLDHMCWLRKRLSKPKDSGSIVTDL